METVWGIYLQKRVHTQRLFYWKQFSNLLIFVMLCFDLYRKMDRQIKKEVDIHVMVGFIKLEFTKRSFFGLGLQVLFEKVTWVIWEQNSRCETCHWVEASLFFSCFFCDLVCYCCGYFFMISRGSFKGWNLSWSVCRHHRRAAALCDWFWQTF